MWLMHSCVIEPHYQRVAARFPCLLFPDKGEWLKLLMGMEIMIEGQVGTWVCVEFLLSEW